MSGAKNYGLITTDEALQSLVDKLLAEGKPVGFDVETGYEGPDRKKGSLDVDWDAQFVCGFSITNSPDWARYVPVAHDYIQMPNAWEIIRPVLEQLPVIAHNMKFERRNLRALERKGRGKNININVLGDSVLQSYVLAEHQWHSLKKLTKAIFDHDQAEISTLFPDTPQNKMESLRFNVLDASDPEVYSYACEDAVWCLALHDYFAPRVEAHPKRKWIYNLEMKTMDLLCDMEDAGHAVDWEALNEAYTFAAPFEERMIDAARRGLSDLTGEDQSALNLGSSLQMRKVLYEDMGLSTTRKTKKGELSTDATALEALSREYIPIKKVLESREVKNLAGRLKKWSTDYSLSHDDRVHASFNQVVENTGAGIGSGRFSANDPSIQQLPKEWRWATYQAKGLDIWDEENGHWDAIKKKGTYGKEWWGGNFRDFLIAADGCYLLFFDYSQVELRCLAGLSQEPYLIDAFNRGVDIHTATAAMMLGKTIEQVTKKDRAKGKTINFGIVFGMGAKLLAEQLGIEIYEAEDLLDQYMSAFTNVSGWIAKQKAEGKHYGFVETHFGRKVTLWDLQSEFRSIQGKGERLTVNAPVQGTAADIMKISMLRAQKALIDKGWWMTKVRLINNVHDALTFEVDNDVDPWELRNLLLPCVSWTIPTFPEIVADWEIGQAWGSANPWKNEEVALIDGTWQIVKPELTETEPDIQVEPEPEPENLPPAEDLIVELTAMPLSVAFGRFIDMLKENPGDTLVTLTTPEGTVDLEKYRTSLTPENQPEISMLMGGAKVYHPAKVDVSEMAEGLEL